jgi:hypothetical protein
MASNAAKRKRGTAKGGSAASPKKKKKSTKGKRRGGVLSVLEGWWQVNVKESDSPEKYLKFMGLPDIAISAGQKAHTEFGTYIGISIKASGRHIVFERHSRLINGRIDKFKFGERVTTTLKKLGEKNMQVTAGGNGEIVTTSTVPTIGGEVEVTDVRMIDPENDNQMIQKIKCKNKKTGDELDRNIFYMRTVKPNIPLQQMPK